MLKLNCIIYSMNEIKTDKSLLTKICYHGNTY